MGPKINDQPIGTVASIEQEVCVSQRRAPPVTSPSRRRHHRHRRRSRRRCCRRRSSLEPGAVEAEAIVSGQLAADAIGEGHRIAGDVAVAGIPARGRMRRAPRRGRRRQHAGETLRPGILDVERDRVGQEALEQSPASCRAD